MHRAAAEIFFLGGKCQSITRGFGELAFLKSRRDADNSRLGLSLFFKLDILIRKCCTELIPRYVKEIHKSEPDTSAATTDAALNLDSCA